MNPIIRNILGVVLGLVIGSIVNGGIIMIAPSIVPLPEGMNPMDPVSIAAHIDQFTFGNFAMVFLAHALGTFVGALIACKIAGSHHSKMAYLIGILFLAGGIMNAFNIPAPAWFIALDILLAYLPMAFLAQKIASPASN